MRIKLCDSLLRGNFIFHQKRRFLALKDEPQEVVEEPKIEEKKVETST